MRSRLHILPALGVLIFALPGCEGMTGVQFRVQSSPVAADSITESPPETEQPDAEIVEVPIEGATILIAPSSEYFGEPHLSDRSSERPAPSHVVGDGSKWPIILRTDSAGRAKYSELQFNPLCFLRRSVVSRAVLVRAPGYRSRVIMMELDVREYLAAISLSPD